LVGLFIRVFDPETPPMPSATDGEVPDATDSHVVVDSTEVYRTIPLLRSPPLAQLGIGLSRLILAAICAWVAWRSRSRLQADLAFGLSLVAMLLISPITWDHYLLVLLVAWALIWVRLPGAALARGLFLAISAVLWAMPPLIWRAVLTETRITTRPV